MKEKLITLMEIELQTKILRFTGHKKIGIDATAYYHLWNTYARSAKRISVICEGYKADYILTKD